jgi:flagellar export protein FliJ
MPSFRFRLSPVQKLRESVRDERRASFGDALRAQGILDEQMAAKRAEIASMVKELTVARGAGKIQVERLIQGQRYEALLRAELMMLLEQAKKVAAEVERRRELLAAADRDVRVLEKLRETQYQRFLQEEAGREIKFLDDVAGQRFGAREDSA